MAQPNEKTPTPPPLPPGYEPASQPAATGDCELSDEDLEHVVGGISLEGHQFLDSVQGPPTED